MTKKIRKCKEKIQKGATNRFLRPFRDSNVPEQNRINAGEENSSAPKWIQAVTPHRTCRVILISYSGNSRGSVQKRKTGRARETQPRHHSHKKQQGKQKMPDHPMAEDSREDEPMNSSLYLDEEQVYQNNISMQASNEGNSSSPIDPTIRHVSQESRQYESPVMLAARCDSRTRTKMKP